MTLCEMCGLYVRCSDYESSFCLCTDRKSPSTCEDYVKDRPITEDEYDEWNEWNEV